MSHFPLGTVAFAPRGRYQTAMRPSRNSLHYVRYLLGLSEAIGETFPGERVLLEKYARGKKRLAEIGVFHGVTTRLLRTAMAPDGVLLAIDPFFRSDFGLRGYGWARLIAHSQVRKVSNGRVLWIETMGKDAPGDPRVQAAVPLDFVFFDGDHSYEGMQEDWTAWRPHLAPGAIACFHDSRAQHATFGCAKFLAEVISQDPEFAEIDASDTLTVLRRRGGG